MVEIVELKKQVIESYETKIQETKIVKKKVKRKKKKKMRITSIDAFYDILPTLQNREMQVLQALKEIQPANNLMISKHLHLPINCITGRTNSMKNGYQLIIVLKKDKCPINGTLTDFYAIPAWMKGALA